MEVIIQPDQQAASSLAARYVARRLGEKPGLVLGLATGSTPLGLYQELVRLHREGVVSFQGVTTFNLDEYIGLPPDHACSYRRFMQESLFDQVDIKPERTHVPDGLAADVPAHCREYERSIVEAGGIDLQIVGIGSDGHIGFNEPTSSLASRTRIKTLTQNTIRDNARFFDSPDEVPRHCITMGVGTIMDAREVLFLAFGEAKAGIVAETLEGPITTMVPASVLQMHPVVKVFLDEAAASRLKKREYYDYVYENKPDWQEF